jgi:hypothetical protein
VFSTYKPTEVWLSALVSHYKQSVGNCAFIPCQGCQGLFRPVVGDVEAKESKLEQKLSISRLKKNNN